MVDPRDLPTDPAFARRIELNEAEAWLDLQPVLPGSRRIDTRTFNDTPVIFDQALDWPHSLILLLGFHRPATPEVLSEILDALRAEGIKTLTTEVSPIARPGTVARMLTQAGFNQTDRSVVVARHTGDMPEPDDYFRIRSATVTDQQNVRDFMELVLPEGPDWLALLASQIERPLWRFYVALEGEIISALGAIHRSGDMGWLSPVWVHPDHRNRGTRTALVSYAVRDAEAQGVHWLSASYPASIRTRSFERLGFAMVYQRRHFVWEQPSS
jgi:N-acetylglutamate synthase-like GNAT family acetyltransferase